MNSHPVDVMMKHLSQEYCAYSLNPRLKKEFLIELLTLRSIPGVILFDEELYPNQFISTRVVLDYIRENLDPCFFNLYSPRTVMRGQSVDMRGYFMHQNKKNKRVIQVGSKVIQVLDGTTYVVTSINLQKDEAVILNEEQNIMMRVSMKLLILSDKA